jgi:starch synthase
MKNKFKILYVASEVAPFPSVGKLADVAGALPKYLKNLGHEIRVMMPNYKSINERKYVLRDVIRLKGLKIPMAGQTLQVNGKSAFLPNSKVQIYFLDNSDFFERDGIYGSAKEPLFEDNASRFMFFALGCLETLKLLYWQPDIIHCNDWQTGLIPALLKTRYHDDAFFQNTRTVLSVCSSADDGKVPGDSARLAGVTDVLSDVSASQPFDFMACGLTHADVVTISDEVLLAGEPSHRDIAKKKKNSVIMVRDGIDGQLWDAENGSEIEHHFSAAEPGGKTDNKKQILTQVGLRIDLEKPLLAVVPAWLSRAAFDAVLASSGDIAALGIPMVFVGPVEKDKQIKIDKIVKSNSDLFAFEKRASEAFMHAAIAGSDILLLPNEPGLGNNMGQLYALSYGTLPIVLHKTLSRKNAAAESVFEIGELSADKLLDAVKDAVAAYQKTTEWRKLQHSAMNTDFSWDRAIDGYVKSYQKVAAKKK